MKIIFKGLLLLLMFLSIESCNNRSNSTSNMKSQQEKSQIKYDFKGVWVRKDYVDNLKHTHSPYKSFRFLDDVSSILVKKNNDDIIEVGLCLGNHEGSSTRIKNKEGKFFIELYLKDKKEWLPIYLKENLFFKYGSKNYEFVKVLNKVPKNADAGVGIQMVTNKILLGNKTFSNADISEKIYFKQDGIVKNFKDYTSYEILTDFTTAPHPMDYIILKNSNKKVGFHFKLTNKDLILYKYNEEIDDFELKYTLSFK